MKIKIFFLIIFQLSSSVISMNKPTVHIHNNPSLKEDNTITIQEYSFHKAVKRRNILAVKNYLSQNININAQDSSSNTALHLACRNGDTEIINLLLLHKANAYIENSNKMTPIELSMKRYIKSGKNKYIKVIDLFIEKNFIIEINQYMTVGQSPIERTEKSDPPPFPSKKTMSVLNITHGIILSHKLESIKK